MTTRRQILRYGVSATALPVAARAASVVTTASSPVLSIYAAVFDARFEASKAFARRSESLGLATRAFDGDMTAVWYHDLYHRWREGPVAIAGVTARGALFCFEQLARAERMRLVFRAEHRPVNGGVVQHRVEGPITVVSDALRLASSGTAIGPCMAEVIAACPARPVETATTVVSSTASLRLPDGEDALYSWIIAPTGVIAPTGKHAATAAFDA
jgi:hypothetical protein